MSDEPIVISDDDDENAVSSSAEMHKSNAKRQAIPKQLAPWEAIASRIKQEKLDTFTNTYNLASDIVPNCVSIIKQEPFSVSSSTAAMQNYSVCSSWSDQSNQIEDMAARQNQKNIQAVKDAFARGEISQLKYEITIEVLGQVNSSLATERINTSAISNGSLVRVNGSHSSIDSANTRSNCSTPIGGYQPPKQMQTSSREPSRSRETSMSSIRNDTGNENSLNESIGK